MTKLLALLASCAAAALVTVEVAAQSPAPAAAPALTFEVASIKPNTSVELGASFGGRPGQLTVRNNTLFNIVRNAYQLQGFQIVGGPGWMNSDRFDITAKGSSDATMPQMIQMVQALLADRFKLRVHRETREIPIYALVLDKPGTLGPQLHVSTVDCAALAAAAARSGGPNGPPPAGRPQCGTRSNPGRISAGSVALSDLARNLSGQAGRIIIDKTGLTGRFDLDLEWTPSADQLPPESVAAGLNLPRPPADGPSLFSAMQEQLGLKLESQRGPVEVLVIDSAERPTPD